MKGTIRYLAGIAGPSGYGSKSTADQVLENCSDYLPSNLTAIVTGATSGIGAETAKVLAKNGVRVIIAARNINKANEVKEGILKEKPNAEMIILEIDLSSFDSVQRFCSQFLSLDLPLNILINNAGIYSQKLELSEDKIELTFATNYMVPVLHLYSIYILAKYGEKKMFGSVRGIGAGHFLLTELLLEKMVETAEKTYVQGRIINVSSVVHSWVKREQFNFCQMLNPKKYNGTRAYSLSKLANILHAQEIARQLKERNARVSINAVHPGIVKTGIIRAHQGIITDSLYFIASKLLKSTSQGAATTCYVALSPQTEGTTGRYFSDCGESFCSALANDESLANQLWIQTHAFVRRHFHQPLL